MPSVFVSDEEHFFEKKKNNSKFRSSFLTHRVSVLLRFSGGDEKCCQIRGWIIFAFFSMKWLGGEFLLTADADRFFFSFLSSLHNEAKWRSQAPGKLHIDFFEFIINFERKHSKFHLLQSYFGFSVAMLIQMLLTLIILIIVSTLYLSSSQNANDHLLLEIVSFSIIFSQMSLTIFVRCTPVSRSYTASLFHSFLHSHFGAKASSSFESFRYP